MDTLKSNFPEQPILHFFQYKSDSGWINFVSEQNESNVGFLNPIQMHGESELGLISLSVAVSDIRDWMAAHLS